MATRWGSRQKRRWTSLSVDETPGSFRLLGEDEATQGGWPAATLPDSALNGKGMPFFAGQEQGQGSPAIPPEEHEQVTPPPPSPPQKGQGKVKASPDKVAKSKESGKQTAVPKQGLSASLPRTKPAEKKPSVFKAFTWSKGKKSRSKLSEGSEGSEDLSCPREEQETDPEIPDTESGHPPPGREYAERAVDVPGNHGTHKAKSSRTSSSSSSSTTNSSSSDKESASTTNPTPTHSSSPSKTKKKKTKEGDSNLTKTTSKKTKQDPKIHHPQGSSTHNDDRRISKKASTTNPTSTTPSSGVTDQPLKTHGVQRSTNQDKTPAEDVSQTSTAFKNAEDNNDAATRDASQTTTPLEDARDESPARESSSPGKPPFDTGRRFRLEATVLVDDQRPAERRVTYLGPVLLSPVDRQRPGHYVHVTVAPGFGNQASEGGSLMVRPARPVPVPVTVTGSSSAPAAKESTRTEGNRAQITAIPKPQQTQAVNSQQNQPSLTRATEAGETASSSAEKGSSSSSSKSGDSGSKVDEGFMNAEPDVNVSSRMVVPSDQSSSTEPSGNVALLDSGTETLRVVTEDPQAVFGPSPSPIPVDQSVVGKSSPLQFVSPQLGSAACSFDGGNGRVSEYQSTPQKRQQQSGSTSSSSSSTSSGEEGSKLGSYDFGESGEKVPDKSEVTHAGNRSEKDTEPSQAPTAVEERPCERVTTQQQESMAAPEASPTDSPRRMGSFGRPRLELLDPHVLLSDESKKRAKEPRGTPSATENRCDLSTSATLEVQSPEMKTTSLPQPDVMIKETVKDCKLVVAEPVVISVTEHPEENSLLKGSITVHQPKPEELNQSNDKRAEQDTTPSNGDSVGDDSKEKTVVKRPGPRPQKPVRVSLVKEDVTTAASTAPPNAETERPPLPLKGTPRQSSSSSPSSSSDSDDSSSRNKSTGNDNESANPENVHSTAQKVTPQSVSEEPEAGDENVKGLEFQNDKDGSGRNRQVPQMKVDPAEKQSSSSSPNSSQFFTDTSLMEDIDLPDTGKLEIHSTHEASPQLPVLPTSAGSSSKEASESDSSASSSVCGKKGARKPPVFVTPPPPPEIAVRTCASQSDLSERSDVEQDMVRTPPKPARSMDRLSPVASPAFDREKKRDKSSTSTSPAPSSSETDQDTKPPLVPPRREKPRVNGADHVLPNHRPHSGDHSADASCASSCDSKSLAQLSDPESVQSTRAGKAEHNANQGKPAPPAGGQPLARESDPSGASAFVPYEDSQIYFSDTPFTASHAASGSGQSIKGKSSESKSSSSSGESKKEKEYSPPPVPPRLRVTSKSAIVNTLNASTSSTASLDSRGSDGLLSTNFVKTTASAECILRAKNVDQLQGEHSHIDRPRAGTCPQIHLSHAVRDKADSSFESELPVQQSEPCTSDSSIFHSDVKLPLKPIRTPSPRTASRTPSPKPPAPQTPSPKPEPKSPSQSSGARGKTRGESTPHTDTDTSEADMRTSVNRSVSMSSSTSATSHEDVKSKKGSRSKLGKYWPFRRKKANKKDKKLKGKALDDEKSVSSPHLASLPLHQSTPTLDRYASEPNTSDISTSNKGEISDVSKLQDSDTSTLSESAAEQSKQKKAGGKYVKDKKAHLSTSTSSSEQTKAGKAKEKDKKKAAKKQKEITASTGRQSTSSSKTATPTPERKSKGGSKPEQRITDSKDKLPDADKHHETSTSSSPSTGTSSKNPGTGKDTEDKSNHLDLPLTPPRVATPLREHTPPFYPIPHHTPQDEDIQHHRFDGEFQRLDEDLQADADVATAATERRPPMVVVAVDLGTTHSGYAFSFSRDPSSVYVMSRWAGQEPGLLNHKTLSALLLTPDARFHSFGLAARNHYHNLLPIEARHWLYFERFKMTLHHCKELSRETMVTAVNGTQLPALTVFAHVLEFFATHALQQLSDQSGTEFRRQDVRWVVTVPAIWREPAKQLMRQAALSAGMFTRADPSQMLIVLEPEAASIYCRKLRMHQLVPEVGTARPLQSPRRSMEVISNTPAVSNLTVDGSKSCESLDSLSEPTLENKVKGTRYLVVDCGGGTVDITVHELTSSGQLVELHRATGGPHGSTGVDEEFEALLRAIFSSDFLDTYQRQYPVGWVNLMTDFESRKRAASPFKTTSFNVSLPFTFISEYRKHKGEVDVAVKRHGDPEVEWSLQGMLRLAPAAMRRLFAPTLVSIRQAIGDVLNHPNTRDLRYLFLVGGFAESPLLQHEVRREFGHLLTILIPQDVSLAVLRGAVLFGLDPKVVSVRCARLTYGVGILNRFDPAKHPAQKRVHREGTDWCTDIFDRFVAINEPVALGTSVTRRYTPARSGQLLIVLNVYSSVHPAPTFITDPGVRKCGTLYLDLRSATTPTQEKSMPVKGEDGEEKVEEGAPREILARMAFGDTEISVTALDVSSGKEVKASMDFLSG